MTHHVRILDIQTVNLDRGTPTIAIVEYDEDSFIGAVDVPPVKKYLWFTLNELVEGGDNLLKYPGDREFFSTRIEAILSAHKHA